MSEKVKVSSKTPESKRDNSVSRIRKTDSSHSLSSPIDQILFLQRTIGNQAVQRLFKSGMIQAKLTIGQPGDKYEQEADWVADEVMRMPEPGVQRQVEPEEEEEETLQPKPLVSQITPLVQVRRQEELEEEEQEELIQAKPLAEQITPLVQCQVEPEEEEETLQAKPLDEQITPLVQRRVEPEEEEEELQAKVTSGHLSEVTPNLESNILSLRGGGGQPLPESARAHFEPRFGRDFSQVRMHTDTRAAESARAVNARAYTVGQNVVFGAGQYVPGTQTGQRLLAHELAHVVQQSNELTYNRSETNLVSNLPLLKVSQVDHIIYRQPIPKTMPGGVATPNMVGNAALGINDKLQALMRLYAGALKNFYVTLVAPSSKQVKPQFGKILLGMVTDEVFNLVGQKIRGVGLVYNIYKEIEKEKQRASRAKTMHSVATFFITHNKWITRQAAWLMSKRTEMKAEAIRKFKKIRYSYRYGLKPLQDQQAIVRNLKNQYWLSLKLYLNKLAYDVSRMTQDHIFKLLSAIWIANTRTKYFRSTKMSSYIEIKLVPKWNVTKAYIHAPGGQKIAQEFNKMRRGVKPLNLKARKVVSFYFESFRTYLDANNRYKGGSRLLYSVVKKKRIPVPGKWDGT